MTPPEQSEIEAWVQKVACTNYHCGWHGLWTQVLGARNPFELTQFIHACPKCKTVQGFAHCCDEHGCWDQVCAGTPTLNGYRQTCHKHLPSEAIRRDEKE